MSADANILICQVLAQLRTKDGSGKGGQHDQHCKVFSSEHPLALALVIVFLLIRSSGAWAARVRLWGAFARLVPVS